MASNSTQVITDLQTAATATYSATATAAAIAAAGPIMDLPGVLTLCQRKAQEIRQILCYVLEGKQISTSLTAPSGGVIATGTDTSTYDTLVGVYQIMK